MSCKLVNMGFLASPDPYNVTERLELSWTDFAIDWTSGILSEHHSITDTVIPILSNFLFRTDPGSIDPGHLRKNCIEIRRHSTASFARSETQVRPLVIRSK